MVPPARHRAGQQLGEDRECVPLCAPNGSSEPRGSRYITSGSVVGAPCASIRLPAGRCLPARFATATLPIATAAGRHVEQERRLGGGAGHADADRIGGKPRVAPAERGHQPLVIRDVHEM